MSSPRQSLLYGLVQILSLLLTVMTWPGTATAAQLTATWTEASTNVDGFQIERATGTTGTFSQIATTNVTSYTDANLAAGTTYCYRVRAYNAVGDSAYSNEACGTALSFSGWAALPGATLSGPAVVIFNGGPWVFVRDTNSRIYQNHLTAGGWSGWSEVPGGGATPAGPGATVFSNTLYLFIRGTDNRIYQNRLTANGWNGWSEVPGGGATFAGPAAAVFQNFLYLTVQGTDNRIHDNLLTSVGWTGWAAVPGNMLTPSGPAATVFNGELWYVVRGADDRIYRNLLPAVAASDWTGWVEVLLGGGFTPSEPGAAATASTLYLVVRGEDNGIYLNQATLP